MEEFFSYFQNGQVRVKVPDRVAQFARNHFFVTQLDFHVQEEEQRAREEEKRWQ
jgi:hypothetical protein